MICVSSMLYFYVCFFFFFKQKTAYEMRISDRSSDVCSSDLGQRFGESRRAVAEQRDAAIGENILGVIGQPRDQQQRRTIEVESHQHQRGIGGAGETGDRKSVV